MALVDVHGLLPSFAVTVALAMHGSAHVLVPLDAALLEGVLARDPLLGKDLPYGKSGALVRLFGPDGQGSILVEREAGAFNLKAVDVIATDSLDAWPWPEPREGPRWLIAERDVVQVLLNLLDHAVEGGTVTVAGRRGWSDDELQHEVALLEERTEAGQDGSFTATVLGASHRPFIAVQTAGSRDESSSPDLAPLHRALQGTGIQAWQPRLTVREALMHHIALKHGRS